MHHFGPIPTMLAVTLLAVPPGLAMAQAILPDDPQPTCAVTEDELAGWFTLQEVTENGPVAVPDSVNFDDSTDCNFYKWSAQMFLWLTSNAIGTSNPDAMVFDSPAFYDISPKDVSGGRTFLSDSDPTFPLRVPKIDVGEMAEAGSNAVLITQPSDTYPVGAPVFFGVHGNDVYAWFRTLMLDGTLSSSNFPTSSSDLSAITDAMAIYGASAPDAKALTMELKTAWVPADAVSDPQDYVVITAEVPNYALVADASSWTPDGTVEMDLALVGMHIVGTVNGHPEMVWATVEHVANAPNAAFTYTNADGTDTPVVYDSSGDWLFLADGAAQPDNSSAVITAASDGTISASAGTIGPVATARLNPWGTDSSNATAIATNTQIISLNNSVLGGLIDGDPRKNYVLIGAVWTQDGTIPNRDGATLIGSVDLANTTMETFEQSTNCFTCHNTTATGAGTDISHVYDDISGLSTQ